MERRQSPRIEVVGRVRGHLVSFDTPVVVRDMSLGGLLMEMPFRCEVGSVHELRVAIGDGAWVSLRAEVRHCRHVGTNTEIARYLTGVRFLAETSAEGAATIASLIETIKSS